MKTPCTRRGFFAASLVAGGAMSRWRALARGREGNGLHLSTNAYSWAVFYQREGRDFAADLDAGLAVVKASGLDGYEPSAGSAAEVEGLAPRLRRQGLEMRSIYVGSALHTEAEAEASQAKVLAIARAAKAWGTRVIVTNPNPLAWGGPQAKTDDQLRVQAAALNRLGRALADLDLVLAYHNHDVELRNAGREFHHMMNGTDPRWVSLCLDAHWVFRGSGNSQVALFDVVKLYGERVVEVHLRQSSQGIWSETLATGDIDYAALGAALLRARRRRVAPHLVLEVAVENGTPKTLDPKEAHRRSAVYAREVFTEFRR